jgi:hypothetical protein
LRLLPRISSLSNGRLLPRQQRARVDRATPPPRGGAAGRLGELLLGAEAEDGRAPRRTGHDDLFLPVASMLLLRAGSGSRVKAKLGGAARARQWRPPPGGGGRSLSLSPGAQQYRRRRAEARRATNGGRSLPLCRREKSGRGAGAQSGGGGPTWRTTESGEAREGGGPPTGGFWWEKLPRAAGGGIEVRALARRIQAGRLQEETTAYNLSAGVASAWENGTCPSSREATSAASVG